MKRLTPRQRQIVALLILGCETREIMNRLEICRATLRFHLRAIAARLPGVGTPMRKVLLWARELATRDAAMTPPSIFAGMTPEEFALYCRRIRLADTPPELQRIDRQLEHEREEGGDVGALRTMVTLKRERIILSN